MPKQKILVIGGAGYIGSYVNKRLAAKGYSTIVLDDLSRGHRAAVVAGEFIQGDMGNEQILDNLFSKYSIAAVFHFAALTDVGESIFKPSLYYHHNVVKVLHLLDAMIRHKIHYLIFSSSAAIFGMPLKDKIAEDHPCHPINCYGHTKLMVEKMLQDFDVGHGLKSCCLRYFNAAGADPEKHIAWPKRKENNLIPLLLRSLLDKGKPITLFGTDYPTPDGSCIRDYIHIHDLASAHIQAMERLFSTQHSSAYNLGNARGYSVKEVIAAVEKVTGQKVAIELGARRPGDPAILIADAQKAEKELAWQLQYRTLEEMIEHAWSALTR